MADLWFRSPFSLWISYNKGFSHPSIDNLFLSILLDHQKRLGIALQMEKQPPIITRGWVDHRWWDMRTSLHTYIVTYAVGVAVAQAGVEAVTVKNRREQPHSDMSNEITKYFACTKERIRFETDLYLTLYRIRMPDPFRTSRICTFN